MKSQLGLERRGGRTCHGAGTRVAQRLLALAAAVWHNWTSGAPNKRSLTAFAVVATRSHRAADRLSHGGTNIPRTMLRTVSIGVATMLLTYTGGSLLG